MKRSKNSDHVLSLAHFLGIPSTIERKLLIETFVQYYNMHKKIPSHLISVRGDFITFENL